MLKEDFMKYLRYEKNYSTHTEISYLNDLAQFQEFVESENNELKLEEVDADIIRIWIAQLVEQGLKASSINRKLSTIKSFFLFLQKKEVVGINPARHIKSLKTKHNLPSFVQHSDMVEILSSKSLKETFEEKRNIFLIEILYVTGIRREELIGLKDQDLDLSTNTLIIHGKGDKDRTIPISDNTKHHFLDYLDLRDREIIDRAPYIFVRKNGKRMYPGMVYNIVNRYLSDIKTLSVKSPHVLRHSFATVMLNNGAEISAIKELLGHASLSSTQIYTHVTFKELKKVYYNAHPRA